jgi:Uma2 family endonuclease
MATTHAKTKSTNGTVKNGRTPLLSRAQRPAKARPMHWSFNQYLKMAEWGWFEDRRVELIGGEIIEIASMLHPHWMAGEKVEDALRDIFGVGYRVVVQKPLRVRDDSAPEPDIAVLKGQLSDFENGLPTSALLVVEISDATLRTDRTDKASLYASAGIEDYWIVNLKARQLEIYRTPIESKKAKFGWDYKDKTTYKQDDTILPLAAPKAKIKVADLLP